MSRFSDYYKANRERRLAEAKAYHTENRDAIKVARILGISRPEARAQLSGRDWLIVCSDSTLRGLQFNG